MLIGGGHSIGGPNTYFRGRIDEVEIFRRALTAPEINSIYLVGCAGKCRDRCGLSSYVLHGQGTGHITLKICNGSDTAQSYTWSLQNLPVSLPDCTKTGLAFNPSTGGPVNVPAYGCVNVTVGVTLPGNMGQTDTACYSSSIMNLSSADSHSCSDTLSRCSDDLDGDGFCDDNDNCTQAPNPGQGYAVFGQTVTPLDKMTFRWPNAVDADYVRGPLNMVSAYVTDLFASVYGTSFTDTTIPSAGQGFYYVVRLGGDCTAPSWQTTLGSEPGRDEHLP